MDRPAILLSNLRNLRPSSCLDRILKGRYDNTNISMRANMPHIMQRLVQQSIVPTKDNRPMTQHLIVTRTMSSLSNLDRVKRTSTKFSAASYRIQRRLQGSFATMKIGLEESAVQLRYGPQA